MFDSGETELIIHGLGAAQYRAYELALQLQSIHQGTLGLDVRTGTVKLTGNFYFIIKILLNHNKCFQRHLKIFYS